MNSINLWFCRCSWISYNTLAVSAASSKSANFANSTHSSKSGIKYTKRTGSAVP